VKKSEHGKLFYPIKAVVKLVFLIPGLLIGVRIDAIGAFERVKLPDKLRVIFSFFVQLDPFL
jgi:hypothetical protein